MITDIAMKGMNGLALAERLKEVAPDREAHRAQIMERLGVRDLDGLVRFAVRIGLISDEN